jgi:hypothetical protein
VALVPGLAVAEAQDAIQDGAPVQAVAEARDATQDAVPVPVLAVTEAQDAIPALRAETV